MNAQVKKRLNKHIALLKNAKLLQDEYFNAYSTIIVKKYQLLQTAFDVSLSSSVNQKELVSLEIKDIDTVLNEGNGFEDLAISIHRSAIAISSNIHLVYKKMIKGLEIELLEQAANKEGNELFNDLSTIRALLLFKEYLFVLKNNTTPPQTKTKTNKIPAPVIGWFCGLVNASKIDKKEETENATEYCKRICYKYKLPYTERVRQNYNVNETKKLKQQLTERVFPLIDTDTKELIQKYIDSKQLPKQNLYV
jgi:hypothetical protein